MEMTKNEAVLYREVYVPAFVEKCAERGISFPDEDTLDRALEMAASLKTAAVNEEGNRVKTASEALRSSFGLPPRANRVAEKKASDASSILSTIPEVRAAALSV